MKLRQIEFAVAIARSGSFSRAAGMCNATQPTLSNGIRQLEAELGGKLFMRTTRSLRPTPFGRHVLPHLEAILGARDEAVAAAAGFRNPQRKLLRLGLSPLVDMRMVTSVTEPFSALHQGVEIFFKECLLDDLGERLDTGAVDIAILPRSAVGVGLDHLPFYTDPLVYLPRSSASAPDRSAIALTDLPNDPVILTGGGCGLNDALKTLFDEQGAELRVYPGHATSYPVIEEWAWMGIGAGVLPRAKLTRPDVAGLALMNASGTPAALELVWAWPRGVAALPHVADFRGFIRHKAPRILAGQVRSLTA